MLGVRGLRVAMERCENPREEDVVVDGTGDPANWRILVRTTDLTLLLGAAKAVLELAEGGRPETSTSSPPVSA